MQPNTTLRIHLGSSDEEPLVMSGHLTIGMHLPLTLSGEMVPQAERNNGLHELVLERVSGGGTRRHNGIDHQTLNMQVQPSDNTLTMSQVQTFMERQGFVTQK